MDVRVIAEEICRGYRIARQNVQLIEETMMCPISDLQIGADYIRAHFCGERVELCSIINGRSGSCSEDCRFCAQSAYHRTGVESYTFLSVDEITESAIAHDRAGIDRYSIVTAGYGLEGEDFVTALKAYERMREETGMGLCASHGFLSSEQFEALRLAGVTRYHCNIETSAEFFPQVCTTHLFSDKLDNIRRAKTAGLDVCSGGIIGMGESRADRLSMAFTLQELGIRSIPINVLIPIPGTPFADLPPLPEEELLRTVAIFRFINPEAQIRLAAGRSGFSDSGSLAFAGGASAAISGDMLTTVGATIRQDRELVHKLGRKVRELPMN
ncbi:MAG: biotin synthase BioB [Lachnospiraceae bacterium]|nr:biotin synthase BioB [Lachnospiraceae bacterium]MDY5741642.1 biotin synthase BioB [Lachnospiraceae bacterium]